MKASTYKQTLINFLNENLEAARLCLSHGVKAGGNYENGDVLGFPAAILILASIDAMGVVKCGLGKSFEILATSLFDSQPVTPDLATDLFQAYRNPFLHNSLLVPGRYLSKGDGTAPPFVVKDKNIVNIDLASLLKLTERALTVFESAVTEKEILTNIKIQEHINARSTNTSITEIFQQLSKGNAINNFPTSSVIAAVAALDNTPVSGTVLPPIIEP